MFVIIFFLRNFCLIAAHLPYVMFFFLVGGGSQSERNPHILPVFSFDLVFQSCSHVEANKAAATKADSKVLWVILESHEKNQNGVLWIALELFRV